MDGKNIESTLEAFRSFLALERLSITAERSLQAGHQVVVTDGVTRVPVTFYTTGTILIQGTAGALQTKLQSWKQEQGTASAQPLVLHATQVTTAVSTGREARFKVPQDDIENVKQLLSEFNADTVVRESPQPFQLFRIDVHRNKERVVATQHKSGVLQIQGRTGQLFEDVCAELDNVLSQSFAERGARYVPDTERKVILEHMSRPQTEQKAIDWIYKYLGQQVYEFLPTSDREAYLSGAGLFLSIEEMQLQLSDYSIIVMPFARSYEGFIIQLAVQLGITTQENIQASAESMKAGDYLNKVKERIEKTDKTRHGGIIDTLLSVWRDVRNKVMHSDPINPPPHREFRHAEQDIQAINRAISRGYEYFVERGIIHDTETNSQLPLQRDPGLDYSEIDTEGLLRQLEQDGYQIDHPQGVEWVARNGTVKIACLADKKSTIRVYGSGRTSFTQAYTGFLSKKPESQQGREASSSLASSIKTPKATIRARIGIDESGKGDYFGPLVISAVYVDVQTESQLVALGVRDSKRLQDHRILTMAKTIQDLCSYAVVPIGPKSYNELYSKIGNLNRLLAWGHARALENVLNQVSCDLAVADQFGDESFLLNALMSKGRQIHLEQRPRAEEDIAVAAASILARAEFVGRIEQISHRLGKKLPKGASDPSIISIGREILNKGGESALSEVAKLHFKTTKTILQS